MEQTTPALGISAALLRRLASSADMARTTRDACADVVLPHTDAQACSYAAQHAHKAGADGRPLVGAATVYVSHVWDRPLGEAIEVMLQHAHFDPTAYFYFDLLSENHHIHHIHTDPAARASEILDIIRQAGTLILVLSAWQRPAPLARAWCLWELFGAFAQDAEVLFLMPQSDDASMQEQAPACFADVLSHLRHAADLEAATASGPADQDALLALAAGAAGSVADFNARIRHEMLSWFVGACEQIADDMTAGAARPAAFTPQQVDFLRQLYTAGASLWLAHEDRESAISYLQRLLELEARLVPDPDSRMVAAVCANLGALFGEEGLHQRSIAYFEEAVAIVAANPAACTPADLAVLHLALGNAWRAAGHPERATACFRGCVALLHAGTDPQTLACASALARACAQQQQQQLPNPAAAELAAAAAAAAAEHGMLAAESPSAYADCDSAEGSPQMQHAHRGRADVEAPTNKVCSPRSRRTWLSMPLEQRFFFMGM
jgi:tetratricopeptide (TPR) repeat protein